MELFDTHFHYYPDGRTPREYYAAIKTPELKYLLAAGADFKESRTARDFAAQIDDCWFAAGVHPHAAAELEDIRAFDEFSGHDKLAAVGELGLDYFYNNSPRRIQRAVMERFLGLALEWKLPGIIHLRDGENKFDAYADALAMLKDFAQTGGRFVVHCFSGTPDWAEKFLELGAFLGITGIITFPRAANVRATLRVIPDDRLVIETDSPYLAPVPYRGKPNNPGYLIRVAEKIAAERSRPVEEIAALTTANSLRLFKAGSN
ncbi:MAG: TatD family hydrolase [Victivallaceae bacterium]|nr:TatD family hydrolase [Victivallaceae bacterium]